MRRKWSTFRRLSSFERRVLFQSLVLLPLTILGLHVFGFRKWQAALTALVPPDPTRSMEEAAEPIRSTARMVRLAAARGLSRPSCLPRSLVLWFLLRRQKVDARLRIGVRKESDALDAHAWVECDGLIVNDRRNVKKRFVSFATR